MIDILKEIKKNISNLELKAYMKKNNHIFSLIDDFIIKYYLSSQIKENKKNIIDSNLIILEKELKKIVNTVECNYIGNDKVVIRISNKKIRDGLFSDFDKDTLPHIKIIIKEKTAINILNKSLVEYNVFSQKIEMNNNKTRFKFEGEYLGNFSSYTNRKGVAFYLNKNHKSVNYDGGAAMINTFNYPKKDNRQDVKVNININYETNQIYIKDIITPFKIDSEEVLEFNNLLNSNFNMFDKYLENKENKNCLNDAVDLLKLVTDTENRIIKGFFKLNDYSGIRLFDNDYLSFKKSKLGLFSKLFKK